MKVNYSDYDVIEGVVVFPFPVTFAFNRTHEARNKDKNYWFTPTGICKLWVGGLHLRPTPKITKKDYNTLMRQMKKHKSDILTNGRGYYTTGNDCLIEIIDLHKTLIPAKYEYIQRWCFDEKDYFEKIVEI